MESERLTLPDQSGSIAQALVHTEEQMVKILREADQRPTTETAVFNHLFARYYAQNVRFSYWRGKREHEVTLVAEVGGELIPFQLTYRAQHTGARELKGLTELCQAKRIARGYVLTKSLQDFGRMQGLPVIVPDTGPDAPAFATQIVRIPACLLC